MTATSRKGFDPLLPVMAVGFIAAVGALAYPAFRADPLSAPGLVLIFTAGAVALIGLFAYARGERRRPLGDTTVDLLDAMAEPAALVWSSGQVLAFNAAWAESNGAVTTLPKGRSAAALYMAFAQARAGEQGRAIVVIGEREQEVLIGQAALKASTWPDAQTRAAGSAMASSRSMVVSPSGFRRSPRAKANRPIRATAPAVKISTSPGALSGSARKAG